MKSILVQDIISLDTYSAIYSETKGYDAITADDYSIYYEEDKDMEMCDFLKMHTHEEGDHSALEKFKRLYHLYLMEHACNI